MKHAGLRDECEAERAMLESWGVPDVQRVQRTVGDYDPFTAEVEPPEFQTVNYGKKQAVAIPAESFEAWLATIEPTNHLLAMPAEKRKGGRPTSKVWEKFDRIILMKQDRDGWPESGKKAPWATAAIEEYGQMYPDEDAAPDQRSVERRINELRLDDERYEAMRKGGGRG